MQQFLDKTGLKRVWENMKIYTGKENDEIVKQLQDILNKIPEAMTAEELREILK